MALDFLNPDTIRSLLEQGQQWHLSIKKREKGEKSPTNGKGRSVPSVKETAKNIIHIGELVYEDLRHELDEDEDEYVPYGYEEDYEEPRRVFSQSVLLSLDPSHLLPEGAKVTLKSYEIVPENHASTRPVVSFVLDNQDQAQQQQSLEIISGKSLEFVLKFTLPIDYHGSLNRFLMFDLQSFQKLNEFSTTLINFKIGILLLGNVVHKAAHHSEISPNSSQRSLVLGNLSGNQQSTTVEKKTLSKEATPFIPISQMLFFNHSCDIYFDEERLWKILSAPPHALQMIAPYLNYRLIEDHTPLFLQYLHHHRNNTIQSSFLIEFGLNQLNEVLYHQLLSENSRIAYLQTLQKLNYLEEMANHVDYYRYDLHFLAVSFVPFDSRQATPTSSLSLFEEHLSPYLLVQCKIGVRGSNELRPKILTGNKIRFRPCQEDCQKYNLPIVEMVGVVLNYVLATEESLMIVSVPKHVVDVHHLPSSLSPSDSTSSLSNQALDLWNRLKYHIRFVEDRSLYSFINYLFDHRLISTQNDYLLRCFFPTRHDIDLLQQWKAQCLRFQPQTAPRISKMTESVANNPTTVNPSCDRLLNAQQKKAIQEVLFWTGATRIHPIHQTLLPMPPFIVFGPAGTGKTSTVIEMIIQLIQLYPNKRILACAPSEAAADVIALRLAEKQLSTQVLHRFNWWQRLLTSVPSKLLPYCNQYQNLFEMHNIENLLSYQVIVTTCQATGSWLGYDKRIFFDVVIVDEASQATEAETFLPLSFTNPGGLMVLAGDIHQLGPQTKFPFYQDCIPFASFQERLLNLPYYFHALPQHLHNQQSHLGGSSSSSRAPPSLLLHHPHQQSHSVTNMMNPLPTVIRPPPNLIPHNQQHIQSELILGVFLNQNYRTHDRILTISSQLFYHQQLIACGESSLVNQLSKWTYLEKHPMIPMVFYNVDGNHEHDLDSPSYYNEAEVMKVVELCQSIAREGLIPIREIGVIAAFRKQVLKIRQALRAVNLHAVNVGGVEDFQGQEVTAVIISTVLTSAVTRFLNSKGSFGLMNDAKRFNVSITRGMALCAVVGHRDFLLLDPYWKHYVSACDQYQGIEEVLKQYGEKKVQGKRRSDSLNTNDGDTTFFKTVEMVIQQIITDE